MAKRVSGFNRARLITHLLMVIFSIAGCELAYVYAPNSTFSEALTIGLGYVGLILLAVTLLIGPLNLYWKRRNPVNIDLRRDIGIWAGIAGVLHVIFSLQIDLTADIWGYFFNPDAAGIQPRSDLFGLSNYVGLLATLILVVLLITSNQLSLRWLKGKRWKLIQRFNYPLMALVLIHTIGYLVLNLRESFFYYGVIGTSLLLLAAQLVGVGVTLRRNQKRWANVNTDRSLVSELPLPVTQIRPQESGVGRRKFLITAGALVLGGFEVGIAIGQQFGNKKSFPDSTLADLPPAPQATTNEALATSTPVTVSNLGEPTAIPNQATPKALAPTSTPVASTSKGLVLATKANLKPGNAIKFTTPDTGQGAFLVCEADGSFKAFSSECTHRPYELVFDGQHQALVCNLHAVPFDIKTGAPLRIPARTALPRFAVQVDAAGNVIYSHA